MGWIRTDQHREALLAAQAEAVAKALADSVGEGRPMRDGGSTAGGDKRRARGVPIIAQGIPGTAIGTDPLGALLADEARRIRAK